MKKLIICLFSLVFMASCVDDLDEYNFDQKRATNVPAVTLFTGATKNLTDVLTTPNVNTNNYRFYVQHWTSTQYLDEPRYNMTSRTIPQSMWTTLYRDVLNDLKEAKRIVNADQTLVEGVKKNQLAQIEIMEVYTWSVLVNTFGDVPYTEALDPLNALPAYDDAQTVYNDILNRLDAAVKQLDPAAAGFAKSGDILYGGSMTNWVKFGNSLKLKLGMVVADVDNARAKALAESATAAGAGGVISSNAENASFEYLPAPPNNNPISSNVKGPLSTREDYVAANTLVDVMNDLSDPRREFFFTSVGGVYKGGKYGFPNDFAAHSTASAKIADPTFEALLLDYAEVEFLLAEAVERGYAVGGTAAEHYNAGVKASIKYWGGSDAQATAYLAQPGVNYLTAPGDWRQKIGKQEWIALYNRGYDAWVTWRRLDAPTLVAPVADLTIPTRLIYPVVEQTLNPENHKSAAAAIGGDDSSVKLWWDVR
ncbi:SusD/RagB family nutrient-binding outer membrane lipoprotein [Pontibacter sp. BT310]|uniref:SusD/RagB family nutrient-binding outer membrane lipoprotein n=1 Tax=Pontibacter populi TaxID=890055 RepID=A0ABS6XG94_9BACT|nr:MULTISPECIES: SusD/RagB family nutrient-binding outer membrane lipoprotein [Pontibacter]MBJ6120162.1 SusD/RagB family nutrient-binding outer membrane lipoprotein [Pontibacter sp. BT310]MBR0572595.1 SusD/RagB family nutrient-binding outer membrane lipoprotein [Microvirga sp. STS03]MBW3367015.1 SusD/RagB family nutrient-binding outer membrane lipoprotein [Pontibacter populi]